MRVSTTTVARFWLDQQGSALIEGAAMVPLLILFFVGVFEFSWFFYRQHLVTIGLHDAASYLARSSDPCNLTSHAWKTELEQAKTRDHRLHQRWCGASPWVDCQLGDASLYKN